MSGKDPCMPWYVNDWFSSPVVIRMTLVERAAYFALLGHCWMSGDCSLPSDEQELKEICGLDEPIAMGHPDDIANGNLSRCKATRWELIREQFIAHPSIRERLTNAKLLACWTERQEFREAKRASGVAGAAKRWAKTPKDQSATDITSDSTPINSPMAKNASSSSSSSSKNSPSENRAAGAAPPPKKVKSRKAFEAPSVDQVAAYCHEKQLAMDPAEFVDHYEANGWKQSGGQPIVSWQATARGWARRQVKFSGGRPVARQPAGSTTNSQPQRTAWRSQGQKPVPRFELAEIQTAEAFLRAARAQDYHDGSADCDVTSLAAWHMAFRRHCDMTTGQIGRADWNAFLGELAQNMRAIASGGTLDGTFMIPRDWQRAEQDAGHASVVAPPAAVSRSVRVCDGRPA